MQEFFDFIDSFGIKYECIGKDVHDISRFERRKGQVYALYKDEWVRITGRNNVKFMYNIYCPDCGKFLREDNIFSAVYNKSNYEAKDFLYTKNFKIRCKKCSSKLNSINSREKIRQTCLNKYRC